MHWRGGKHTSICRPTQRKDLFLNSSTQKLVKFNDTTHAPNVPDANFVFLPILPEHNILSQLYIDMLENVLKDSHFFLLLLRIHWLEKIMAVPTLIYGIYSILFILHYIFNLRNYQSNCPKF